MSIKNLNNLISEYHFLVPQIASKFKFIEKKDPDLYQDLLQEGTLGLIESFNRFDESRGVFFYYYARKAIKNNINSYIRKNQSILHIPTNILYESIKLKRFELSEERSPESKEKYMNCNDLKIRRLSYIQNISFQEIESLPFQIKSQYNMIEELDNKIKKEKISKIIDSFPPLIKSIFYKKINEEKNFRTIGKELGFSHEKARLLFNKHIDIIKEKFN